eukprot:CAMPEP_0181202050 /NCGR_PEP_ID=MMETSP1096-20121128/18631_1 /TAXON_ID=156174 ORGANISM="Chrysochromulina ericina, Strain CCMP281" /NCGR_SAMPLE_ID=MMETSP1096 /ASSEMBLY_ACC=CAM_ASM_000453 /LENGTH=47 /DNA_ID= /DNA_START= /DNA_END= /DNA_ORIENTATION=
MPRINELIIKVVARPLPFGEMQLEELSPDPSSSDESPQGRFAMQPTA